jgi:hypothetical protein
MIKIRHVRLLAAHEALAAAGLVADWDEIVRLRVARRAGRLSTSVERRHHPALYRVAAERPDNLAIYEVDTRQERGIE